MNLKMYNRKREEMSTLLQGKEGGYLPKREGGA